MTGPELRWPFARERNLPKFLNNLTNAPSCLLSEILLVISAICRNFCYLHGRAFPISAPMFGTEMEGSPPTQNFGLDIKMHNATHTTRGYEKFYYLYEETFWREHGGLPSWFENWLRKGDWLGVYDG